jgi:monovalent cation/proton antiporter MnhG/PhaG subunit
VVVIATVAAAVLLGAAVLVALLSAVGIAVMRDPYQRLHFISPPASLSALLVVLALLAYEPQKQAALKAFVVAFVLYFMNAIVTHATARAHFVRENGTWPPPKPIPDADGKK